MISNDMPATVGKLAESKQGFDPHELRDEAYIPAIDGLRAVAVTLVMLYHLHAPLMPGGFTGVDVFFVISGYVVSGSLGRDAGKSFLTMLRHFYARRILRIVPALLLCIIGGSILTLLFIPMAWLSLINGRTAIHALFGASNFVLVGGDAYFEPRPAFNPFTHTWSLAVEEQFYLLFPAIFFFCAKLRDIRRYLGIAILGLLCAISIAVLYWTSRSSQDAAFYLLPSRFWELGAGALLFQLQATRVWTLSRAVSRWLVYCGAVLVVLTAIFADPDRFPYPWALPAVLGSALLIAGISFRPEAPSLLEQGLSLKPVIYIGKISYSLYLWHWIVYTLLRWTIGLETPAGFLVSLPLTFLCAAGSYHLVERPIRHAGWIRQLPKGGIVAAGLASILLSAGALQIAYGHPRHFSLSVVMRDPQTWSAYDTPKTTATTECKVTWKLDTRPHAEVLTGRSTCAGSDDAPPRLFVIGDSHAGAYRAMLSLFAAHTKAEVQLYTKPGCGFATLLRPQRQQCAAFIDGSMEDILQKARHGDMVFMASLRSIRFSNQWGALEPADHGENEREAAYQEARSLIERFIEKDLVVLLDAPKPLFRMPPFRCSDWFNRSNPVCAPGFTISREELLSRRAAVMDSIHRLSTEFPALVVWDPFPVLCPGTQCSAYSDQGPLFFDGDHLSNLGNRALFPSFMALAEEFWPKGATTKLP